MPRARETTQRKKPTMVARGERPNNGAPVAVGEEEGEGEGGEGDYRCDGEEAGVLDCVRSGGRAEEPERSGEDTHRNPAESAGVDV